MSGPLPCFLPGLPWLSFSLPPARPVLPSVVPLPAFPRLSVLSLLPFLVFLSSLLVSPFCSSLQPCQPLLPVTQAGEGHQALPAMDPDEGPLGQIGVLEKWPKHHEAEPVWAPPASHLSGL